VTRGALYYHFRNKQDLFRAVFVAVQEAVFEQVATVSMAEPDPWAGLLAGCSAFLAASLDPAVQQIVLIDAPAVLGWGTWREVGSGNVLGLLVTALHWAMAAGQIEDQPAVPLAHVVLGALNEGALFIAGAEDRVAARDEVTAVVFRLLAGLRPA
jgi:AcrR family transcriptional regulator